MTINITSPETERLARELARVARESLTEAVTKALRDRLAREMGREADREQIRTGIRRIQAEVAALPMLDDRTPDEILGYDESSLADLSAPGRLPRTYPEARTACVGALPEADLLVYDKERLSKAVALPRLGVGIGSAPETAARTNLQNRRSDPDRGRRGLRPSAPRDRAS